MHVSGARGASVWGPNSWAWGTSRFGLAMISQRGVWVENASRQAVSEELLALGKLPSEAELSALIERYAGSTRVSCEQADLFFASVGEVVSRSTATATSVEATTRRSSAAPARRSSAAPRDAAEVARGSWLDKLGPRSSAPPRTNAEAAEPALSSAVPQPAVNDEPITIEHGLEHLPATTYSSAPPPSALPSEDTPVALPLSSRPAPQLTAADSLVVERWGMAETSPEPTMEVELVTEGASTPLAAPSTHEAQLSAEEDELLDRWSEELDETILGQSEERAKHPSSAPPPPSGAELHAATDAPERWSAPHLGGEVDETPTTVSDDDAPLSATELSLLDQWNAAEISEPAPAQPITTSSRAPARSASLRPSQLPPIPSSLRPPARSQPAPVAVASTDDEELDMELEEAIELDPDDLIEDDVD
jgi:hypothetical protein